MIDWLLVLIGFIFGWGLHDIILQLAYKMKIVEYKGASK